VAFFGAPVTKRKAYEVSVPAADRRTACCRLQNR